MPFRIEILKFEAPDEFAILNIALENELCQMPSRNFLHLFKFCKSYMKF